MRQQFDDVQRVLDRVRPVMQNDPFFLDAWGDLLASQGELARATELAEETYRLNPNTFSAKRMLGLRLMNTAQWERVLELDMAWMKITALRELGRTEEATMLARKEAADGGDFHGLLNLSLDPGQYSDVVKFFDDRWGSVDTFLDEFSMERIGSKNTALQLAQACQKLERADCFEPIMKLLGDRVQFEIDEGLSRAFQQVIHARYFVLAGDNESAINCLERANEWGYSASGNLLSWREFELLRGDPRFEAVQSQMRKAVNRERQKLGLEPLTA